MGKQEGRKTVFELLDTIITKSVKAVSYLGAIAIIIIMLISTANVIATKVFRSPISNITELVTYLNLPVVFMCIGYVQLDHGHTHIDLIYQHFPKPVHKIIHILGYVTGVVVCSVAGWRGIVLAMQKFHNMTYASGSSSSFLIWPYVACIGIGYLVLAISFLWSIPKELHGCGPYEMQPLADDPQEGA